MTSKVDTSLIPLADWIEGVREQVTEAQRRYLQQRRTEAAHRGAVSPRAVGLGLEEITLEAEIVAQQAVSPKLSAKLFVLSAGVGGTQKESTTQKIVLRFTPARNDGQRIVLGDADEPDAFDQQSMG